MCARPDEKLFPRDLIDAFIQDLKDRRLLNGVSPEDVWEMRNEWFRLAEPYRQAFAARDGAAGPSSTGTTGSPSP